MNKEEKITISVNEEDVQNIINAYEKDIEYINQLEKENKELKRKLNEAIHKATEFESEVYELEKQLENYKKLGFKHLQDKNNNLETQQKEFIKWLEDEKNRLARECSNIYEDSLGHTRLVNENIFDEVNDILQKYKSIIGVSDEFKK